MPSDAVPEPAPRSPALVLLAASASLFGAALFAQTVLESQVLASAFFSPTRWVAIVGALGGKVNVRPEGVEATASFAVLSALALLACASCAGLAAAVSRGQTLTQRLPDAAWGVSLSWLPAGAWWLGWIMSLLAGWTSIATLLQETVDLTAATCIALTGLTIWRSSAGKSEIANDAVNPELVSIPRVRGARWTVAAGIVVYVVVFTAMNWGLWFNLRIPHGDSAMYEEHLWNLEHGKGFRSYLDQGLFLGEHLQVVHVLLVPLHIVFPSHLTLELAQSVILALGAVPVFNMARRHSRSEWAAAILALAYLAYVPLHSLDIAIDLKTFRPNSFGIPTLLMALDQLERRRYGWACLWLAITLSAQEDWAIPIALVGAWLVASNRPLWPTGPEGKKQLAWGMGLFVFSVAYLWLALNVVIPWFRGGATVHTASYFSKFGSTPREIVVTLFTHPTLVMSTLVTPAAVAYLLRLLVPIGLLPLRSPGRLLVAAPLFLLLCMNDLAMQVPAPVHHFHAPLIPLLFWAAAAGLEGRSSDHSLVAVKQADRRAI